MTAGPITPDQWERVKNFFHDALQQSAESREQFLIRACPDDVVRLEVERLLRELGRAGDFLDRPVAASFGAASGAAGSRTVRAIQADTARFKSASSMTAGETLDRYEIVSLLGSGGMGMVYRAHDPLLRRSVAVKLLLDQFTGDETAMNRFRSEAHALSALNHPNICMVHDIGERDGRAFIVMEYVPGTRLDELIARGEMPLEQVLSYAGQIAAGLANAHAAGIVHRDLKPGNIMVTGNGQIKLLDFGVAKLSAAPVAGLARTEPGLTMEGTIVGTAAYMSPEQAEGKDIDARSDIFAFGAVLYEMLTGKRAFAGTNPVSTLLAVLNAEPKPIRSICPGVPLELERIVERCLCKDPAGRFQEASALSLALRKAAGKTESGSSGIAKLESHTGRVPRMRFIAAVAFALLLAVVAWAAIAMRGSTRFPGILPGEKRLAVLPLNTIGNDEEVRAFADGLVETLTSKLTQLQAFQGILMVVPANEVRSRKIGSVEAARRIYGANLAITGSAQRWGDEMQFTLNLVDTTTIRQIASRTFVFDSAKPVTLRDEAVDGAIQLLALRLTPKARELIQSGDTSTPGANAEYLKGIGYLARYDLMGNVDRAIQSLTEATRRDPGYALAFSALGQAHWVKAKARSDAREKQLALESIQQAIRLNPGLAEPHMRLGEIYYQTGQVTEAIQEERTALHITPANGQAYRILGDIYTDKGQYGLAETAYKDAVQRQPADWLAHLHLAIFYTNRGRNALARQEFGAALKITPDNEVVYRNLAILDIREGNFRQASDNYVKTLRFEKNARTYALLGGAYYYQRRYPEAVAALTSGIQLDPGLYYAWGNLGTVYRHMSGHEADARNAFNHAVELAEKALEVTKSDDRLHADLAEYRAKLGEKEKALAQLGLIPNTSRNKLADEFALVYELTGDRRQAMKIIEELPRGDPLLTDIRSDPDLEALWSDPALRLPR